MDRKLNIALIGFMGCGKSTIGKRLATELKYRFLDTDNFIEEKSGLQVSDIFKIHGEDYFRALERETVEDISNLEHYVIATGGGIVKNKENINSLKSNSIIIYLKATAEKIYSNVSDNSSRPLLENGDKFQIIKSLLMEREPLYISSSDMIIDVSEQTVIKSVYNIVDQIRRLQINK